MNSLIICEKANAAKRIAQILSDGKAKKTNLHRVPVYDYDVGDTSYTVVGLRGHILALDYPKQYSSWYAFPPSELIRVKPIKKIEEKGIASAIKDLSKEADEIIVATDFDREGELIGAEIIEYIKEFNPDFVLRRARFSALTKGEITGAFAELQELDYNLSSAAESRQVIDLAWGAVLTRFISRTSGQVGKDFLSAGRVQSPTLGLIVDREKDIQKFIPEAYWEIYADLEKGSLLRAKHTTARFKQKDPATAAYERARQAQRALVSSVDKKERREVPPPPFSTTMFIKAATGIGLSAAECMRIAEDLYTEGYISYPRTDNTVYPKSLNLRELVDTFAGSGDFTDLAKRLKKESNFIPSRGKKEATDHPPIHPVQPAPRSKLNDRQWKVFELVVRRFFATLAPKAVSEVTNAKFDLNGEPFGSRGLVTLDPGWRFYYPYSTRKEEELPHLEKGDELPVKEVVLEEKETQPPSRYTEGSLIMLMEKHNLGTKSTRHEIIQKLYNRRYVDQKPLRPSLIGSSIIDALEKHAEIITKPEMTATLEKEMEEIANGNRTLEETVEDSHVMLEKSMAVLLEHQTQIGDDIRQAMHKQNTIGTCSKCGENLRMIRSRRGKRFVGCAGFPNCRNSFPLPQSGKIDVTGEICDACGSPKIKLIRARRRPVEMCLNMECPAREEWTTRKKDDEKKDDEKDDAKGKEEEAVAAK